MTSILSDIHDATTLPCRTCSVPVALEARVRGQCPGCYARHAAIGELVERLGSKLCLTIYSHSDGSALVAKLASYDEIPERTLGMEEGETLLDALRALAESSTS